MTLTTEVKRLAESKPVRAIAGAGDLAVETIRELPERLTKLRDRQYDLRGLQHKARDYADDLSERFTHLYEDLAQRGEGVVERIQSSESVKELEASAKATQKKATQAAESARKTAKAAGQATKDAASKVVK